MTRPTLPLVDTKIKPWKDIAKVIATIVFIWETLEIFYYKIWLVDLSIIYPIWTNDLILQILWTKRLDYPSRDQGQIHFRSGMIGEKQNLVNSKISKDFGWQTGSRRFNEVLSDRQTRSKPRSAEGQIVQPISSRGNESTIQRNPDIIQASIIPDRITNRTNQVEVWNPSEGP